MKIGNKFFDMNKTNILGILNITPDSFSDGGNFFCQDKALKRVEQMINQGVDILDIGGESTRPNYTKISEEEEINRVCPIIQKIKNNFDIPISIDTYKAKVAKQAILSGADMINDIWGLKYDDEMIKVLKEFKVPYCLMHNRHNMDYTNFLNDVINDIAESLSMLKDYPKDLIILDPGIGFAKTYDQNILMLKNLEILHQFNLPILLGTSRKSVIGLTLDLDVENRLEGTLATTALAIEKRCSFVRVHDIQENYRFIKMYETLKGR